MAIITGATSGIGNSIAQSLGKFGLKLVVTGRRRDRLDELISSLETAKIECFAIPTDFSTTMGIEQMFEQVRTKWGEVSILINNAGLGYNKKLQETPRELLKEMLDVNVLALTSCMREAIKDMEILGAGHIINISSMAGHRVPLGVGSPNLGMYSATKHAVRALTEAMRGELAEKGSPIKIGAISPGLVDTEFHSKAGTFIKNQKILTPSDISDAVIYMLSTPAHVQVSDIMIRPISQIN